MKLQKYENNPILLKNPKNSWEDLCVLNPATIYNDEDGLIYMLYRAAGNDAEHYIYIGLATSKDGIHFERRCDKPLIAPCLDHIDGGGIEDPRLIKLGDYYYLTYAARPFAPGQYWREDKKVFGFKPEYGPRCLVWNDTLTHLAVSKDLINWKRLGRITNAKTDDRDVVIFPDTVKGKFVKFSRDMYKFGEGYKNKTPSIWISYSDDLLQWNEEEILFYEGKEEWESKKVGASIPPVKTDKGWLFIYHGVSAKDDIYRVGAMMLDLENPQKIIAKTKDFIMEPEFPYETGGFYNGCVFPTGIIEKDGKYFIYYGAADQCICLATVNKEEFIKYLLEECQYED